MKHKGPAKGSKQSEEHRMKRSAIMAGRPKSEEHKLKIQATLKVYADKVRALAEKHGVTYKKAINIYRDIHGL